MLWAAACSVGNQIPCSLYTVQQSSYGASYSGFPPTAVALRWQRKELILFVPLVAVTRTNVAGARALRENAYSTCQVVRLCVRGRLCWPGPDRLSRLSRLSVRERPLNRAVFTAV